MPYSNWLEAQILNHMLRTDWTPPGTWYVALFTAAPNDAGGGTEVSGGSYARVAISRSTGAWNAPTTGGLCDNTGTVSFPTPTAGWGDVEAVALFDASSGGNMGPYTTFTPVTINTGASVSFANGALDVTID